MVNFRDFMIESNKIEGVDGTNDKEVEALANFVSLKKVEVGDLEKFVSVIQPDAKLRRLEGMNVKVGIHVPLSGGKMIEEILRELLSFHGRRGYNDAFYCHMKYENLHPFMDGNGRSGRALWLWHMSGDAPLGFLHHFYYQTLEFGQKNRAPS